jgi:hypothetical protein
VKTRHLIVEKAKYQVFPATDFAGAVNILMNQQLDLVLLCQSLRRGILEKARAITLTASGGLWRRRSRSRARGDRVFQRLDGPCDLLKATGKQLMRRGKSQTVVSI